MLGRLSTKFFSPLRSQATWLFIWGIALSITLGSKGRPRTTPMHVDEVYWIGSSYYFDLLFMQHDPAHPDWLLLPARENPPGAKYVIGSALAMAGQPVTNPDMLGIFYAVFARQPGGWGNETEQAKRAAVLARLNPEMRAGMAAGASVSMDTRILYAARVAMMVCAAACSLAVFWFAGRLVRKPLALIASQAVLLHPLSVEAWNYAMADAPAMLFSTLAGAMVCLWADGLGARRARPELAWSAVTGLALGWACASKMNSLVVAGQASLVVLAWTGVRGMQRDWPRLQRAGSSFVVLGMCAGLAFVAVNPTIWQQPWTGVSSTFVEQKLSAELQAQFLGGFLSTLAERFAAVADLSGLGAIGVGFVSLIALACLFSRDWRRKAVACWWLFSVSAVTQWLPFARSRYVLPLVVPGVLIAVLAVDSALDWWGDLGSAGAGESGKV